MKWLLLELPLHCVSVRCRMIPDSKDMDYIQYFFELRVLFDSCREFLCLVGGIYSVEGTEVCYR